MVEDDDLIPSLERGGDFRLGCPSFEDLRSSLDEESFKSFFELILDGKSFGDLADLPGERGSLDGESLGSPCFKGGNRALIESCLDLLMGVDGDLEAVPASEITFFLGLPTFGETAFFSSGLSVRHLGQVHSDILAPSSKEKEKLSTEI